MNIRRFALGEKVDFSQLGLISTVFQVGFVGMAIFPFFMYYFGAGVFWGLTGVLICMIVVWNFESYRLMRYKKRHDDILTLPGYFSVRFGERGGHLRRFASTLIIFLSFVIIALLLKELGIIVNKITGFPKPVITFAIAVLVSMYVGIFGYDILIKTTRIKAFVMICSLASVAVFVLQKVGIKQILRNIMQTDITGSVSRYMNIFFYDGKALMTEDYISLISLGLLVTGLPFMLTSFFTAENGYTIRDGSRVTIVYMLLYSIASAIMGFVSRGYLYDKKLSESLSIFICSLFKKLNEDGDFGRVVSYIYIIGIIVSFIIVIEGCIQVMVSSLYEDFLVKGGMLYIRKSREGSVLILISMIIGLVSFAVNESIKYVSINGVIIVIAAMGCSISPTTFLSLVWKNMNKFGCVAGLFFGFISVPIFKFAYIFDKAGERATLCDKLGINSVIPSIIMSFAAVIIVSLVTGGAPEEIKEDFEEVKHRITEK